MLKLTLLPLIVIAAFSGCQRQDKVTHNEKPLIAVSILPHTWFVFRIGGERVRTLVLAGQGQNPHNYEPSPRQISGLAGAGAWILSGAEFEISLRPKIERLFPALPIVDGTAGVSFRRLEAHDDHNDNGGDANGGHDDDPLPHELDRHTWLGLDPAKLLAAHIRDTLCALDPAGAEFYGENYQSLVQEIDGTFATLRHDLAPLYGKNIFVYHPSFGYFLDEFGIHQQAVETGGKSPGPRDLRRLIELAREEQPAAIFVQAQFPVSAAQTVADTVGAQVVSLDPLAPNWLENIRYMGEALKTIIRNQ